jgi:hypothetical protein
VFSNLFFITLPNIEKYFLEIHFPKKNYFSVNKPVFLYFLFSSHPQPPPTTYHYSHPSPSPPQNTNTVTVTPSLLSLSLYRDVQVSFSLSLYPRVSLTFFAAAAITHHHMGCQDKLDICGATSAIDLDAYMRCVCP